MIAAVFVSASTFTSVSSISMSTPTSHLPPTSTSASMRRLTCLRRYQPRCLFTPPPTWRVLATDLASTSQLGQAKILAVSIKPQKHLCLSQVEHFSTWKTAKWLFGAKVVIAVFVVVVAFQAFSPQFAILNGIKKRWIWPHRADYPSMPLPLFMTNNFLHNLSNGSS